MGDLLLIRHGETDWSLAGRHTGLTDQPLTPAGERRAASLAPLLARRRLKEVLCSPLRRAVRTAELALPSGAGVLLEADLREWDYGGYEGMSTEEVQRDVPGWDLWRDGVPPGDARHPGEGLADVAERCDRVLARVEGALRGDDGDVVLVAHAHVLRVLTARRLGQDPAAGALYRLDTGTLSTLGREHGRWVIAGWNAEGGW
ncbi:histidine phosphatase family protein [Streptomyces sp. NPDC001941]|uniref:histidine phosphatase family protein n=1 Tax=Streptomyces sp. NPDC001941 TaxID=3154659 RepID=UPI003333C433